MSTDYLSTSGVILILAYFFAIVLMFKAYAGAAYKEDKKLSSLFIYALYYKLFAAIGFGLIYEFYYNWHGDSYYYFINSSRLGKVLFESPLSFFRIVFGFVNPDNVHELDTRISYIPRFHDIGILAVHRYTAIFTVFGLHNFFLTNLILNAFLFLLNWRAFMFFKGLFPEKTKILAAAILFVPSVAFWSSGIIKDSWTYTFTLLFVVYFHRIIFKRNIHILNILKLLLCVYILIQLKPYILYTLIVSGFVWLGLSYLYLVKNQVMRVFVLPVVMTFTGLAGIWVLTSVMGVVGGVYQDFDTMLERAVVTQQDLKQDYYEGASFDIGEFDATVGSAASVTPAAIVAGLYRPFLWEAISPLMFFSGLENFVLLVLSFFIVIRAGPFFFFRQLSKEPFLVFCLVLTLSMALGIGLSTSNFGALVRFKIPMIPFFLLALLWIWSDFRNRKKTAI